MDIEKVVGSLDGYDVEAALSKSRQDMFYFEGRKCKHPQYRLNSSLTFRVTKGGRSGVCTTTNVEKWQDCLDKARRICDLSKKAEFFGIPKRSGYPKVRLGQKRIAGLTLEELKDMAQSFVDVPEAEVIDSVFTRMRERTEFANSNGAHYVSPECLLSSSISVRKKDAVAYELHSSRKMEDFGWVARRASDMCLKSVGKKQGKTGIYDLFLDYFGVSALMQLLANSFYANNVQQGNSKLAKMKGMQAFSEMISIGDRSKVDHGLFSCAADGEGVPSRNKVLVSKGEVREFLYDYTTAMKEGRESTGNFAGLESRPSISETNFTVRPGSMGRDEMLSDFRGIYVSSLLGAHTANPVSGDFSLNAENAFLVDGGEWKPLKHVMVAGNLFELLRRVKQIAKEPRQETTISSPPIAFSDVQIIM